MPKSQIVMLMVAVALCAPFALFELDTKEGQKIAGWLYMFAVPLGIWICSKADEFELNWLDRLVDVTGGVKDRETYYLPDEELKKLSGSIKANMKSKQIRRGVNPARSAKAMTHHKSKRAAK